MASAATLNPVSVGQTVAAAQATEQSEAADQSITVKIEVPGAKAFELQVSTGELVNDLRGYITDREDCCHRTCFSLQYDGVPMDHFAELRSIEGLQDQSVFRVVEEPYTIREARLHVRHVRDLIKSLDTSDAMNGLNGRLSSKVLILMNFRRFNQLPELNHRRRHRSF